MSNPRPKLMDLLLDASMNDSTTNTSTTSVTAHDTIAKAQNLRRQISSAILRILHRKKTLKKATQEGANGIVDTTTVAEEKEQGQEEEEEKEDSSTDSDDLFELCVLLDERDEVHGDAEEDMELSDEGVFDAINEMEAKEEVVRSTMWPAVVQGRTLQVAPMQLLRWGVAYLKARRAYRGLKKVRGKAEAVKAAMKKVAEWIDGKDKEEEFWKKRILMGQRCRRITYPYDGDEDGDGDRGGAALVRDSGDVNLKILD